MKNKQIENIPYFVGVIALIYLMHFPEVIPEIISFERYLLIKCVLSIGIIKSLPYIKIKAKKALKSFSCESGALFYDIPVGEMADYIMKGKFKSAEVVDLFGISHNKSNKAAKDLDAMGVFERDSNNGRVLANVTRAEVVALLKGKKPLEVNSYNSNFFVKHSI